MIQADGTANGTIKTVKHANEALHVPQVLRFHTQISHYMA